MELASGNPPLEMLPAERLCEREAIARCEEIGDAGW
jgi:hypothetical protein